MKAVEIHQFVFGEGMIRLDELSPSYNSTKPLDEPLNGFSVQGGLKERTTLLRLRYEPVEQAMSQLKTREGQQLTVHSETTVLSWPKGSLNFKWVPVPELKAEDRVFLRYGTQLEPKKFALSTGMLKSGFGFDLNEQSFFLLGALSTAINRSGQWTLMTTSPVQISRINQITQEMGCDHFFHTPLKFSRFTGVYKVAPGAPNELVCWSKSSSFLRLLRKSPVTLQRAWLAGLTLTGGRWTMSSLEFELDVEEVATALMLLLHNVGIRTTVYRTLDVYGQHRTKVVFRSSVDFEKAEKLLWEGQKRPCPWKDRVFENLTQEPVLTGQESPELTTLLTNPDVMVNTVHEVQTVSCQGAVLVCPVGSDLLLNGFILQS